MKKILFLLAMIAFTITASAQDETRVKVVHENNRYMIVYEYNAQAGVEQTSFPNGHKHYAATITVFIMDRFKNTQVGPAITGIYSPVGCDKDVAVEWVLKAIENKRKSK